MHRLMQERKSSGSGRVRGAPRAGGPSASEWAPRPGSVSVGRGRGRGEEGRKELGKEIKEKGGGQRQLGVWQMPGA